MTIADLTQSVQFTIDQNGQVTAVVIAPDLWRRIIEALEDTEDRDLVRTLQSRLATGPRASDTLRWQDVADQWQ